MHAIDVRDLVGHPGASKIEALRDTLAGLGTELASVPEDVPIAGELLLESVVEGILASGRLTGTMSLRCARCLVEFTRPFEVEFSELFAPDAPEGADEYRLEPGGALDPEQLVRDAVGLELPFSPLCTSGCLGLCARCGGDLNLGECTCTAPDEDPRWAGLKSIVIDETDQRMEQESQQIERYQ